MPKSRILLSFSSQAKRRTKIDASMLERSAATNRSVYWAEFALLALFSSVSAI